MPDTNPTPEETAEQTARRVIKRWNKIAYALLIAMGVVYLLAMIWNMILSSRGDALHGRFALLSTYTAVLLSIIGGCLWRMRWYARHLSEEEREALRVTVGEDSIKNMGTAIKILKMSGETVPAKEYVRASSPPEQPDTLLRAAQPSADTAQEQLLRPADD